MQRTELQVNAKILKDLLHAAAYSAEDLDRLCDISFGSWLKGIKEATHQDDPIEAIVTYTTLYDLRGTLLENILASAGMKPAVQQIVAGAQNMEPNRQTPDYMLLRMEQQMAAQEKAFNAMTAELNAVKLEVSQLKERIRIMEQKQTDLERRPTLNWTIVLSALILAIAISLSTYYITAIR